MKVKFTLQLGVGGGKEITEVIEYDEDLSDDDLAGCLARWVNEQLDSYYERLEG